MREQVGPVRRELALGAPTDVVVERRDRAVRTGARLPAYFV
jgi:hypothetical protein